MTTYHVSYSDSVTRHDGHLFKAAWECWLGASELATGAAATAWGWYVEAFFSEAASKRYRWVGEMVACLAMLAFLGGRLFRLWLQPRIDAFVESCEGSGAVVAPDLEVSAEPPIVIVEADPVPTPVTPEVVSPEPMDFGSLKATELRKLGTKRGIKGAARMKKADLVEALSVG